MELSLIEQVRELLGGAGLPDRVLVGPGDDAAVVRADGGVVVTSIDTVVDGVHFSLATHSPADVGWKALATALSDLAAMGAAAGEAFVSLILPAGFEGALELVEGLAALARSCGVAVAGGDVVSGPALAVTVCVTGWAADGERLVYRSGARAGDVVGVTGTLGGSGAGLALLQAEGGEPGGSADDAGPGGGDAAVVRAALIARHRRPTPLLACGSALAGAGVSAMIDLSDGLATDAGHLARASGVTLELRLEDLPLAAGVAEAVGSQSPHEFAASAGDDYELLFTAPPACVPAVERAAATAGTSVTWLGDVRAGAGVALRDAGGALVTLSGYEHL